jgi:SH3 domain-containing protein
VRGFAGALLCLALLPRSEEPAAAPAAVHVESGTRLRSDPASDARVLAVIDSEMDLTEIERRGEWVRVRFESYKGWISTAPLAEDERAPAFTSPKLDEARIATARALTRSDAERTLGPYRLLTDVRDETLLSTLDRSASYLAETYRKRTGLMPGEPQGDVVAVFATDSEYRALEKSERDLAGVTSRGHAGRGVAAISAASSDRSEVNAVFVHELTHLLNRRTLGPQVPLWLEEGLAEDLAFCRTDEEGRLILGTIRGRRTVSELTGRDRRGDVVTYTRHSLIGPQVTVNRLADGTLKSFPLRELVSLPPRAFVDEDTRDTAYAESALFVRFLLDAEEGRNTDAFRAFLAAVRAGLSLSADRLPELLGSSWNDLDARFGAWLKSGGPSRPAAATAR